uniref:Protein arginine N-methyltransferase 6 n=1 Tax=Oncorhynchus mykiss TaxID=8022 RepID=A0A8C7QKX1_ONCMY
MIFLHAAFDIYSDITIHEEMIADTVQTNTYRTGVLRNGSSFQRKVVLDVGEGTGSEGSSIADGYSGEAQLALAVSVSGLH